MRMTMSADGHAVVVRLHDNPSSRDLWSRLPLTLTLKGYAGIEKIADLPAPLTTEGAPDAYAPAAGDLTFYAPWGNLAFFCEAFSRSRGLVSLGVVESDLAELRALPEGITVRLEATPAP